MEINIMIAGQELDSRAAAKQLHLIADMVKAGVTEMDGFSVEFLGAFSMAVDFESNGGFDLDHHHRDYWDGEGNHVHVDEEGLVITIQRPDSPDGTVNKDQVHDQGIKLADWAKEHGGITPFGTPEEDMKEE